MADETPPETPPTSPQTLTSPQNQPSGKVKIHFKAVGSAPIMKDKKFLITATEPFRALEQFLMTELRMGPHERLFLYCDSAFAPSPEEPLRDLFACFGRQGELVVNYATSGAFG